MPASRILDVEGMGPFELSKIGDPFVNFVYSLALSKTLHRPVGKKVSNKILKEALARSKLRDQAGSRRSKGDLGDYVEGFIFKAWAEGQVTIDDCVAILSRTLSPGAKGKEREEESISAFTDLLRNLA